MFGEHRHSETDDSQSVPERNGSEVDNNNFDVERRYPLRGSRNIHPRYVDSSDSDE